MIKKPKLLQLLHPVRNERGQSVILIATVIISFLMFFGFAVNTGLLVNAKISLQAAADAAAYAGAATQARQLNAISFLNYDLRRQYKKFIYRYNVVGAMGNDQFAVGTMPNGYYDYAKREYPPNSTNFSMNKIKVPSVCIPITSNGRKNDNCLQVNLPNTTAVFGNGPGLSSISAALFQQLQQIQSIQETLCKGNSSINLFVLMNWLFKTDPGNTELDAFFAAMPNNGQITQADKTQALQTISALVEGLGIFPRNIISLLRIETLEKFLNEPPKTTSSEQVRAWAKSQQADQYERTIQAMESALANINETVMAHDGVEMIELQAPNQIQINPILASFNTYVHYMRPGNGPVNGPSAPICKVSIIPFQTLGVPVGVQRVGNTTVHYAVKLRAKARLLFLPVKDGLELEAMSGAKPFGSRIGPSGLTEADFVESITPGMVNQQAVNDCSGVVGCKVPNMKISGATTFFHASYLQSLKALLSPNAQTPVTAGTIKQGQLAAMAPNPIEVGRYNIIPPPKSTAGMQFEFIPYSDDQNQTVFRFYAPLFPDGQGDPVTRMSQFIDQTFGPIRADPIDPFGMNIEQLRADLKQRMATYVQTKLQNANQSENDESMTFAAIDLPMANIPRPPQQGSTNWLTEANTVLTSWAPTYSRIEGGNLGFKPRFGYSVKFVTMQNLLKSGMPGSNDDLEKVTH